MEAGRSRRCLRCTWSGHLSCNQEILWRDGPGAHYERDRARPCHMSSHVLAGGKKRGREVDEEEVGEGMEEIEQAGVGEEGR